MKRALAALFVVSIAAPLVIFVAGGDHAVGGAIAVATFTVPATFLIGLPGFLAFQRRGWLRWWHAAIGGACVGALCAAPFTLGGWIFFGMFFLTFIAYGATLGLLFWFLAIWRNKSLIPRCSGRPQSGRR